MNLTKTNKNNLRLDLFMLHDGKIDNSPKKWIVAKGKNLKNVLKILIGKIEDNGISNPNLVKHLMNKFNISIASAERLVYLKKEWFPLIFIKELLLLARKEDEKFKIQDEIEFLKVSQPPLKIYKAVKNVSVNLCKLIGAFAADGTLYDYLFRITENKRKTIQAFKNIIDNEFGINSKIVKIRHSKEEWGIEFHSKIISRYIMKFFGFPNGSKTYNFKEPKIIKNRSEFREAYALGALTFEAGIGMKHQIEFTTINKDFRDSLCGILQSARLKLTIMERQGSKGLWRFWSGKLTKEEALNWQKFFEPHTEKWKKLDYFINGYNCKVNSFEEAVEILNLVYPKKAPSKVTLKDVLLALKKLKQTYRYELVNYLINKNNLKSYGGKWAHSLKHYLDILKSANIILVEKGRFGKKKSFGTIVREIYTFNENIGDWRVPKRN